MLRYVFNPYELSGAHDYNQRRVGAALQRGDRLVIVDNTNTMSWEIRPYIAMGAENGYVVHIQQPDTPWFFNPKVIYFPLKSTNILNVCNNKGGRLREVKQKKCFFSVVEPLKEGRGVKPLNHQEKKYFFIGRKKLGLGVGVRLNHLFFLCVFPNPLMIASVLFV